MKTSFELSLARYVFVRVLLCTVIICLFFFGIGSLVADNVFRAIITISFATAMCLYAAVTIARYIRDLVANPLNEVLKSAELLEQASVAMSTVANDISKNADIMTEFSGLLDGMADACNEPIEGNETMVKSEKTAKADKSTKR